jgi:hypothetical protein
MKFSQLKRGDKFVFEKDFSDNLPVSVYVMGNGIFTGISSGEVYGRDAFGDPDDKVWLIYI